MMIFVIQTFFLPSIIDDPGRTLSKTQQVTVVCCTPSFKKVDFSSLVLGVFPTRGAHPKRSHPQIVAVYRIQSDLESP
jgi:hypothetical protein